MEVPVPPPPPEAPASDLIVGLPSNGPTRRWGRVAIAAAAILALVAGAIVFLLPRGGGGTAFALQYSPGQTLRYQMTMTMDAHFTSIELGLDQPVKGTFAMTVSMRVVSVDGAGTATLDLTLEKGSTTVAGQTTRLPKGFHTEIRIAKDGQLVSGVGLTAAIGGTGLGPPGSDQFTPLLPDHPVVPGDTWSKDFDAPFPFGGGSLHYRTRSELIRYEDVAGVHAAVIQSDVTIPLDFSLDLRTLLEATGQSTSDLAAGSEPKIAYGGQMVFSATDWFDPASGQQVKELVNGSLGITMTFKGFPASADFPSGEVQLTGTMTVALTTLP
jgi:hypothetical protein